MRAVWFSDYRNQEKEPGAFRQPGWSET